MSIAGDIGGVIFSSRPQVPRSMSARPIPAEASQRFVSPRRVCPPAITASTCRAQKELFRSESGGAAGSIIGEVRGAPRRRFLIRGLGDMRSDVFATKSTPSHSRTSSLDSAPV